MTGDASPPRHRDVAAFDERATGYDQGWLGRLHHEIAGQTRLVDPMMYEVAELFFG